MFRSSIHSLQKLALKGTLTNDNEINWNFYIEGLAMHTRVLHDFFYYENKKDDDILAKDFLDDTTWGLFQKKKTPKEKFTKIIDKCNKQLAHLTEARVTQYSAPQDKGWNSKEISLMMEVTIKVFWEVLEVNKKEWFKKHPIIYESQPASLNHNLV